jgi:hypothetical protein
MESTRDPAVPRYHIQAHFANVTISFEFSRDFPMNPEPSGIICLDVWSSAVVITAAERDALLRMVGSH